MFDLLRTHFQFDAITQLRNIELNRRASKRMEEMTEDMHELTIKTKKDTSSMHVITFVTLVFLPGTFVAVRYTLPKLWNYFSLRLTTDNQTFLGAGFYQWPEPSDGDAPAVFPEFRTKYFFLFLKISLGLTFATVLLWWGKTWLLPQAMDKYRAIRCIRKQEDKEALVGSHHA